MYSPKESIPSRFEKVAQNYPNKIAIKDQSGFCSYDELNRRANRIARIISAENTRRERPVILLLEQGIPQISATLGVLKAGLFYVPMDPSNPLERNRYMLKDSGATLLITDDQHIYSAKQLSDQKVQILNLDQIGSKGSDENLNLPIALETFSYILYTSGSTGQPKGVLHNHRTILHNVMRHVDAFKITPDDRQTLLYTSSVYGGQRDMFNALLNGASLHVYVVKNQGIAGLPQWLIDNKITIYCSVATVFRMLIQTLDGSHKFKNLRLIKLGGEASHRRDIDDFKRYFCDHCIVHCGLGSTETGLVRNFFIDKKTELSGTGVPLGFPVDGVDIILLDENGHEAPTGSVGEIAIRSQYISLGYWNRPELTEKVFSSDPQNKQIRIYRMGDLACLDTNQCLTHQGRKDFQIKINGNRIETIEVEIALLSLDSIRSAVVMGNKDDLERDRLVAYLVSENGLQMPFGELRERLREKLPDYMIPSIFIWMDKIPLLPNGKVAKNQLPPPQTTSRNSKPTYVAPRSELESKICMLWSKALKIDSVGIHDDFFDLGGSSLRAFDLLMSVEKEFGISLPTSVMAEYPTVKQFSAIISKKEIFSTQNCLTPLRKTGTNNPLFIMHGIFAGVLSFKSILPHLNKEQSLYGAYPSRDLETQLWKYKSLKDLASVYAEQICSLQPEGSYRLSGYSLGGRIAVELAHQLAAKGKSIGLLAIIDSDPPSHEKRLILNRVKHFAYSNRLPILFFLFYSTKLIRKKKWNEHNRLMLFFVYNLFCRSGASLSPQKRTQYLTWQLMRLSFYYKPTPYSGETLLLHTRNRGTDFFNAWKKALTGTIHLHEVQGKHDTLFDEPNIQKVAQIINMYLKSPTPKKHLECRQRIKSHKTIVSEFPNESGWSPKI